MNESIKLGDGYWAFKENALLAYNDENNNFKPIDLNSTRASAATRVNKLGLIESVNNGVPRVDYLNNPKGALLVEPQSTNLVTYSEDFSDASWTKQILGTGIEASVVSSTELAPNGDNSFLVTLNSGTGTTPSDQVSVFKTISGLTAGLTYTESIYLKGTIGGEQLVLGISNIGTLKVTLTTEWQRFVLTGVSGGTFNSVGVKIRRGLVEPLNSYAQFYMYGSQLEALPYATSYIPTVGSTVTRVAETVSKTGLSSYINSSEGVLYAEMSALANDGTNRDIVISDGTNNNRIILRYRPDANQLTTQFIINNSSIWAYTDTLDSVTSFAKIAIRYSLNNFSLWVNSIKKGEQLSGGIFSPNVFNTVAFNNISSLNFFYGKVKDLQVFNQALTDQELQTLTSL